jgi:AraC-like DNA-binding protein
LPPGFFDQEKLSGSTAQLLALWRAVGALTPDPGIGLKLSGEPRFQLFNPASIAAVCSRTFGDALQRIARYKQLSCPQEVRLLKTRDEVSVEMLFIHAEEVLPDVLVDLCLGWIMGVSRRGTDGNLTPLRVELTRPVQNRELLESHFGCRVRFKASRDALVFRKRDLDLPFVTHNEELLQAVGARLESELQNRRAGADIGEQVKQTLQRSLAGRRPTLQHTAREMGMSARTLQRRLTDADFTFQQLLEEARRELAHHYLRHNAVELNDVAYLLGYEHANSFFRAFHEWESTSPGEWRKRHSSRRKRS